MSTHSGIGGAVDGLNTIRSWQYTKTSDNKEYRASNTQGGTGRIPGNKDWSGNIAGYGGVPAKLPGEKFTFTGYDAAKTHTGPVIIPEVSINVNHEDGGIIEHTINFAGTGPLAKTTGTVSDLVLPNPVAAAGLPVYVDTGGGNFVPFSDVRSASLTLSSKISEYTSSSTDGWKGRNAGSIDATGSISFYDQNIHTIPDAGDYFKLKIHVTDTEFWLIEWGLVADDGVDVQIENEDTVSGTISWGWSGFKDAAIGAITKPDGTPFWPAA